MENRAKERAAAIIAPTVSVLCLQNRPKT